MLMRYVTRMLVLRKFTRHPHEVIHRGLAMGGMEQGLNKLKTGDVKGKKFVYRIGEMKGL